MSSDKGKGHDKSMAESPVHPHKARMAPKADSPAGQEQDEHGNVIPLAQRTRDDQEKAAKG